MNRREFLKGVLLTGMVTSIITIMGKPLQETLLHKEMSNNITASELWLLNTGKHHLGNDIVNTLQQYLRQKSRKR